MKHIERIYKDDINEILRKLYTENELTIREIAKELTITPATALKWLNEAGIKRRKINFD